MARASWLVVWGLGVVMFPCLLVLSVLQLWGQYVRPGKTLVVRDTCARKPNLPLCLGCPVPVSRKRRKAPTFFDKISNSRWTFHRLLLIISLVCSEAATYPLGVNSRCVVLLQLGLAWAVDPFGIWGVYPRVVGPWLVANISGEQSVACVCLCSAVT